MREELLHKQDLSTLASIGRAIWSDAAESSRNTAESVAAASMLELTPERAADRAASGLLRRAVQAGNAALTRANLQVISQPFYRLSPEERFVLVALHQGRWSYARLAGILEATPERIEELAWQARIQVATEGKYPGGAGARSLHCPEYRSQRPWTQRFLDEEIRSGSERVFLQNHLMACDSCRRTLGRCRELYFAVDRLIPRFDDQDAEIRALEKLCLESRVLRYPSERTFLQSLAIFAGRTEIQWALGIALFLLAIQLYSRLKG